ncbi:MAG: PilZ domain-containing protein [Candidatus Gorgyraea atricola]|nr:PilZ domain-containing protein [Candidatus Gorgyraea atricola]
MKNDRRIEKRYEVLLKAEYKDPITGVNGEGLTKNICSRGIMLPVNSMIAKGTVLDIKIEDPNSTALISTKAEVAWIEELINGDDVEDTLYQVGMKLLKKKLY